MAGHATSSALASGISNEHCADTMWWQSVESIQLSSLMCSVSFFPNHLIRISKFLNIRVIIEKPPPFTHSCVCL
jgi:hypothetical protein